MAVNGKIYIKDNSGNINEITVPTTDTNAVHKSGNETIADTKTFTGTIITANNAALRRNDASGFLQLSFTTVLNGGRLNLFGKDYTADPGSFALMTGDGTNAKTLKGTTAGVLSWDGSISATGFTGPLTGNATSATKATQDSDGNAINTTYLKLSGGTMTGNIAWNRTATIGGESKAHNAGLSLNANSLDFGVYDWTNSKWAWKITQAGVASFYGNADTATKATQDGNGAVIANTYLKLTGGTLTGPLNIFTDQAYAVGTANALVGVRYKNAAGDVSYPSNIIDVIGTDGTDGYNTPISIGSANGTTHIGAGESRRGFLGARALYNNENLYLSADGSVNIFTNCANDNATYCGPLTFNGTASATGGRVSISNADKINANNIELNGASNNGGYIDFHFNNSTADYTTRLIESASGTLQLNGILKIVSNAMNTSSTPGILLTGTSTNFFINAVNTNITKGSAPSANTYWGLNCYGKDYDNYNKRIAMFEGGLTTANVSIAAIRAYNCTSNTNTNNCSFECHVDGEGASYFTATGGGFTGSAIKNNTAAGALGWTSATGTMVPTMNTLAYWNGAYSGTSSNLAYCNKGAFGTIVTKNTGDYLPISGGTLTGKLTLSVGDSSVIYLNDTGFTKGTTPSSIDYIGEVIGGDKNGGSVIANRLGALQFYINTSGNTCTEISTYENTSGSSSNGAMIRVWAIKGSASSSYVTLVNATPPAGDNSTKVPTTGWVTSNFSKSGHTHSYIPTSGGTLSGVIESTGSNTGFKVTNGTTKQCTLLRGGTYVGLYDPVNSQWVTRVDASKAYIHYGTVTAVSDKRLKTNIKTIDDDLLDAWDEVEWQQFQYKEDVEKQDKPMQYVGIIAQDVENVLQKHNVIATDYKFMNHEYWDKEDDEYDEQGNITFKGKEAGEQYYINYIDALSIEAAYQRKRTERAEARIAELENQMKLVLEKLEIS